MVESVSEPFTGVKVFSVTMARDREVLGDRVTAWIRDNLKKGVITATRVLQSSDSAFHCVSIVLFYR